jgi:hypothetical protein
VALRQRGRRPIAELVDAHLIVVSGARGTVGWVVDAAVEIGGGIDAPVLDPDALLTARDRRALRAALASAEARR